MSIRNVEIQTQGLHIGTPDHSKVFNDQRKYTKSGIFTCAGVSIFGNLEEVGGIATVTIGTADPTSTQNNMRLSLHVNGNSILQGDSQTANALTVSGGKTHTARFYGLQHNNAVYIDGDLFVSGSTDTGNKGRLASRFATADAKPKPFDLEHPTKGKGHRLRYACIEGPEVGVYYRGRTRKNEITLPHYWKDLVHAESITVQIQPIGHPQNIIVKEFDNEKIIIDSENTWIDCFFHVYGERKDINPLITEYEGDSWKDYPDPNFNPDKVDEDERTYTDPRFAGPPNTITK
tara:strand:- start:37 stop:906 length:870 start_codon:yes stop_codon:yes gene_type:complete